MSNKKLCLLTLSYVIGHIELNSEFDCSISSSKSYNKNIATLGIKESRLLVLKYIFLDTSKIIGMSEK
jgi:hypothetical protein